MKYKINELVYVENTNTPKKIVEVETICGIVIYYMSDNTSYSEEQILMLYTEYLDLSNHITLNKRKVIELFDIEKMANQVNKFYLENKHLLKDKKNV